MSKPAMPASSSSHTKRRSRMKWKNPYIMPSSPLEVPKDYRPEKVLTDQWVALASSVTGKYDLVPKVIQDYPGSDLYPGY